MIQQISDKVIGIREIACIGERVNINGYTCKFDIWIRGGAKISITIEAQGGEEKSTYDGPVKQALMDRADKERKDLIHLWIMNTP